jgi:alkylated DNA repair dioxygenase AlkB
VSTLFPIEPELPEGFVYLPDFINCQEEEQLLSFIAKLPLETFLFHGFEAKWKVLSYGYNYHFDSRSISPGNPIPAEFKFLLERVSEHTRVRPEAFKEVLVTEYPSGAMINWHRDAPPFQSIADISLAADCNFRLQPYAKRLGKRGRTLSLSVRRRSLYVISGAARSAWEHRTAPVKQTRYSITLRTLRSGGEPRRLPTPR